MKNCSYETKIFFMRTVVRTKHPCLPINLPIQFYDEGNHCSNKNYCNKNQFTKLDIGSIEKLTMIF